MSEVVKPTPIQWGVNFPDPQALRTGDMLFARKVPKSPLEASAVFFSARLNPAQLEMRLPDYLGPALTLWLESGDDRHSGVLERLTESQLTTMRGTAEAAGSDNAKRLAFLIAILRAEFGELFEQWFNLTVDAFLKHPLAQVLLNALSGELKDGFFIGHCALVLRERDGKPDDGPQSTAWVIEANATSFAHYGVSIRPYHVDDDGADGRFRSWAAFRASRGDAVWHSRHLALDKAEDAATWAIRAQLAVRAKTYLGRSYSFFDAPAFADDGRLYCSEFIHRAFDDVRSGAGGEAPHGEIDRVDDRRRWLWMKNNNPPGSEIGKAIEAAWTDARIRDYVYPPPGHPDHHPEGRPFFVLTVQMLWRSGVLKVLPLSGLGDYDRP